MVINRDSFIDQQVGHYKTIPTSPGPIRISDEDSEMFAGRGGHYGYPDFPPDRDIGGNFFVNKYNRYRTVAELGTIRSGSSRYIGGLAGSFPSVTKYTDTFWSPDPGLANRAYNRMKPTKPEFELANALFELKDLPRMLRERMTKFDLKSMSNYYLALEFGWKPLLRDIRNLVHAQRVAEKRLQQLLRDNGRPVQRRVNLGGESETVTTYGQSYSAFAPSLSTGFYQGFTPIYQTRVTTSEKIWACARFRYWLPEGPRNGAWTKKMKARILGYDTPSPKNVWDAMPWTWLTDWFVDVGSMLESLETGVADRLAADYFYLMRELSVFAERESIGRFRHEAGDYFYASANGYVNATVKARVHGTPFGWNVSQVDLSAHQLSILGALGLSRLT